MRRQRLMSRQEILLRETVRRIVAEADSPPASKKEVVPSDPAEFLDWLMSTGPAYANAVDEREGFSLFLALLETATDATGIGLNYVDDSPNWVGALMKGANIMLDSIGIQNSVLQFTVANDIVLDAERSRSKFDPARADEIIGEYRDARWWAFALLVLSIVAAGASLGEIAGSQSSGRLEAAIKGVKNLDNLVMFAQYAGVGLDAAKDAIDKVEEEGSRFLKSNPDVVLAIDHGLAAMTKYPAASKIFLTSLFSAASLTGVNISLMGVKKSPADAIVDYIPAFRKEMAAKGYI
jgi:hypothetical protein